jgi:phosphotransferase system enzyme I (PtsI)
LDLPALFKTQLRAILRASANHPHLRIMFPMVSSVAEFEQANKLLEECKAELDAAGVPFHREVEVGVMVEIPSAALMAHRLARRVRFFSIGTNDLVQYTLAVDRGNDRVAHLFDPAHPAVLELIERTVAAGREQGISTSVCGEMAGNPVFVPLLMGLGVDTLSVSPSAIALVKAVIRQITYADAVELAAEVRAMEGGEEALARCRELIRQCAPEILELAE